MASRSLELLDSSESRRAIRELRQFSGQIGIPKWLYSSWISSHRKWHEFQRDRKET